MGAKTNLLTLVQHMLRDMTSDQINDLGETEEADQVQQIAMDTYYNLQDLRQWGHKIEVIELTASGDNTQPTRMRLPDGV